MTDWPEKTFLGGHPVLNFLNTAGGETKGRDVERLVDFEAFISWCEVSEVVSTEESSLLSQAASRSPGGSVDRLTSVRTFREATYGFLNAAVHGRPPESVDVALIEDACRKAYIAARLNSPDGRHFEWQLAVNENEIDLPMHRLALLTSTLITQTPVTDIRQCEMCSWLFIDSSTTKRRRWCSMALCGNRAKAQRHYYRSKDVKH
ncbi:hypothetical protein HJB56_24140 [Rhizobium lentis]|uniref:CGNR zinc finger domain-containing protein n=1 Tax=Rhizobium lentis TaxID=1138194 RepID=UPI001C837BF2|nr:ABATE domain-containing protein [Rhizobium lentis]MBX5085826.1 hypothetical protein [Rhizobium lentis]MBX5095451.1 hypothetical protein [Rhizobium lentis]MBX5120528.1 hypothetical protein [Rhizobium lentis]